jgi:hypothetical protein
MRYSNTPRSEVMRATNAALQYSRTRLLNCCGAFLARSRKRATATTARDAAWALKRSSSG